jgi:hypothetical protein
MFFFDRVMLRLRSGWREGDMHCRETYLDARKILRD